VKNPHPFNFGSAPFGAEYAWRPSWGLLERWYTRIFGLLDFPNRLRARLVMAEVDILKPNRILDLGSGTGCYSFYLSRAGRDVSAVDIDQGRIFESSHIAQRLGKGNLRFYCGSAGECLQNFRSETFEMALAMEVLQYLGDVNLTLQEIHRVLKPGGHLVGHIPVLGYLRPQEKTLFDDEKVLEILFRANFQIIKIRPTFGGIPRKLCAVYDRLSRSRMLAGIVFPFLFLGSAVFPVENPNGDYRFFVARKPATDKLGSEDRRPKSEN
jgi:ubiquinone/menaquinone biosynthesis C-methylase UbiE